MSCCLPFDLPARPLTTACLQMSSLRFQDNVAMSLRSWLLTRTCEDLHPHLEE